MALERTEVFIARMSPAEIAMLRQLAEEDGISASDLVRQLVRRTFAARHGAVLKQQKSKR